MAKRLQDKSAVVTGGTSGIGKSIVELFCRHGAAVAFTGRDRERGAAVAAATGATFIRADAAEPDHAEQVVAAAVKLSGRIDVLVNNAGRPRHSTVEGITAAMFDEAIHVNLRAPLLLMSRVVPLMRDNGGSIINMCSVAASRVGTALAYSVSKAGLLHLTRCAAAEVGKHGIRVNAISPGFIDTPSHAASFEADPERTQWHVERMATMFMSKQALSRTGVPMDVATTALFLATDESAFITGAEIVVDGGLIWGKRGFM